MAKIKPQLSSSINDGIKQKEREAKEKILKIEKNKEDALNNILNENNIHLIEVSKIDEIYYDENTIMHNRTGFTSEEKLKLKDLANDIINVKPNGLFKSGLLQPIIVRESKKGRYERIVGFRRIEAFKINEDSKIPAVIINCNDKIARLIRNSENQNRADLNIYDELHGTLEAIKLYADFKSITEVKTFLYKALKYDKKVIMLTDEEKTLYHIVSEVINTKTNTKLSTLVDRIAIFNFDDKIKMALQENNISYSNAVIISRLKLSKDIVDDILEFTINLKPTKESLKNYINKFKPEIGEGTTNNLKLVKTLSLNIKQKDINGLSEDARILVNNKLLEVKKLLKEINNFI